MRPKQHCVIKLKKAFKEWQLLKKNKARNSPTQRAKELAFVSKLEDLFDVAHAGVLTNKSVLQKDKNFLIAQRKKGRCGSMIGVDKTLAIREKKVLKRKEQANVRKQLEETRELEDSTVELESSTDAEDNSNSSSAEESTKKMETKEELPKGKKRKRG